MALLPRRTAIIAAFAAALLGAAVVPSTSVFAAGIPAPVPTGPADDATTPLKDVVLTWNPVAGASNYQVQVSPNAEWTNNTVTLPANGVTPNQLFEMPLSLPHSGYFWRVRAEVGSTWGAYSAPRQFLRQWLSPISPLKSPTSTDPTIAWTPVQDASAYLVRFGTAPDFDTKGTNKRFECYTHQPAFTPYDLASSHEADSNGCFGPAKLSNNTPYFWEVIPLDDSTAAILDSEGSNDPNFVCATVQPECDGDYIHGAGPFTYVAPSAGSVSVGTVTGLTTTWHTTSLPGTACDSTTVCPVTPTMSWNAVPGANFYQVQVFRDAAETNTYRAYDTAWPELTPRDSYLDSQAGKGLYWTVTAGTCTDGAKLFCDADSATPTAVIDASSAQQSFSKASSPVGLTSPANGATVHGRSITFNWTDFQNTGGSGAYDARNYELQVSTTSSFDTPLIDNKDIDLTQFTPTTPMSDGTYFWRVAPIDESSNLLAWTNTRTVTVNATGPSVRITSKNGLPVTGPITIHLSTPLSGVSKSTVKIVPAGQSAAHAVAGSLKLGSGSTTYEFRPKHALVTGETYALSLSPSLVDGNGNSAVVAGNGVRTSKIAKDTSKGWAYSAGWTKHSASGARSGSFKSASAGHTASLQVVGANATLYACKGPSMGKVTIKVAGNTQTVSEHQSFTKCGVAIWHSALPTGERKITVTVRKGTGNLDEIAVK